MAAISPTLVVVMFIQSVLDSTAIGPQAVIKITKRRRLTNIEDVSRLAPTPRVAGAKMTTKYVCL